MIRQTRPISICFFIILLAAILPFCAAAEYDREGYTLYLAQAENVPSPRENVILYQSEGTALEEGEELTFTFSVPENVFGYPVFRYEMTGDNILDNAYTLLLDGEVPYQECQSHHSRATIHSYLHSVYYHPYQRESAHGHHEF